MKDRRVRLNSHLWWWGSVSGRHRVGEEGVRKETSGRLGRETVAEKVRSGNSKERTEYCCGKNVDTEESREFEGRGGIRSSESFRVPLSRKERNFRSPRVIMDTPVQFENRNRGTRDVLDRGLW